ncbi:hypothetical protein CWI38_0404p0010 [Hamiltosporidium tvaerminnensis]|uniref:Uncharacterized protein n=2 Tax=Hamiltosporidium TaxID=1176354 RepID=A0A4Q9KYP6_9MICR|nr:hypothetical protein LUQ84_001530 [Hamiltosporidium tvaerminnensis]TBU00123.1 hypothetical protein CWI39_1781p0010 [Hamiltosporidium magnivora]TBT96727.1 hypothetical protein CWI37_2780p0010 [Hamiltosporidium tvaerminnensis]TBU05483.1 hypothetical protein CWI36_0631p0020 [Hamiltosporidium magnivora]TBU11297.1 hypothetical protein CWI38_1279p0020 [Hamiltosporidium tvaerminnensis]
MKKTVAEKRPATKAPAKSVSHDSQGAAEPKKKKRGHKTDYHGVIFRSSVKRISKVLYAEPPQISSSALECFSCIALDIVESISDCAAGLAKKVNKQTVGADDIIAAFDICYRGELAQQTLVEVKELVAKSQMKVAK